MPRPEIIAGIVQRGGVPDGGGFAGEIGVVAMPAHLHLLLRPAAMAFVVDLAPCMGAGAQGVMVQREVIGAIAGAIPFGDVAARFGEFDAGFAL